MRNEPFTLLVFVIAATAIFSCIQSNNRQVLPAPSFEQLQPPVIEEPSKPAEEKKPESKDGTIVMYTSDRCSWCVRWKKAELAKVKNAGWKFEEVYTPNGPWPQFEVYGRGKSVRHTGYMTMSALKKIVDGF